MIVMLPRTLKEGMRGMDVYAVKRACSRAGFGKWLGVHFTHIFGRFFTTNLKKFQAAHGLTPDGEYGPATHKKMARYFDAYGANEMLKLWKAAQETPIDVAVKVNLTARNYAWQNAYTQSSKRMQIVRWGIKTLAALVDFYRKGNTLHEDCSSFQQGASFIGRLINPSTGTHVYTQDGYTGTHAVHGVRVAVAKKGDLGFYGNGWPYHHEVRALEDATPENGHNPIVGSHGKPGFDLERAFYRSDFSHWRRYDNV